MTMRSGAGCSNGLVDPLDFALMIGTMPKNSI
jgi:hypothetical protein